MHANLQIGRVILGVLFALELRQSRQLRAVSYLVPVD